MSYSHYTRTATVIFCDFSWLFLEMKILASCECVLNFKSAALGPIGLKFGQNQLSDNFSTKPILRILRTSFRIYQAFGGKSRKIDLSQFLSTNSHWLVKKHYAFFSRSERFKFEKTQKNYFVPQRSRKYPYTGMKLIIPMFFPYASKDLSGYFDTCR